MTECREAHEMYDDTSVYQEFAFGPKWLRAIEEALGVEGKTRRIHLKFSNEEFARAVIFYDSHTAPEQRVLPAWGIVKIKEALGLPHIAQHVHIEIADNAFVTIYYKMSPRHVSVDTLIEALKGLP